MVRLQTGPDAVVLAAIAVLDDDATPSLVRVLAADNGLGEHQVQSTLEQLTRTGKVVRGGIVRVLDHGAAEDALNAVGADRVVCMHARAATSLHENGAPNAVVVNHLLSGSVTGEPWAIEVLQRAADEARRRGELFLAAQLLERGLAERPDDDTRRAMLLQLGSVEARTSPEQAIAHYRAVIPLISDRGQRLDTRLRLARCLAVAERVVDALDQADAAIRDAPTPHDRLRAELAYVAISRQSLDTRPLGRLRLEQLVADIGEAPDSSARRTALAELAYERVLAGVDHRDVVEPALAALGGESLRYLYDLPPLSRHVALLSLAWCGELQVTAQAAELMLARARRHGDRINVGATHAIFSLVRVKRGDITGALAAADAVLECGVVSLTPSARGTRAACLALCGRLDEAQTALVLPGGEEQWTADATFHGYLVGKTVVHLVADDAAAALESAQRLGALAAAMGTFNPAVLPWHSLAAEAATRLGHLDEARALADDAVGLARRFGALGPLATALRAAALARPPSEARPLLDEALRLALGTPNALLQVRIAHDRAAVDGQEQHKPRLTTSASVETKVEVRALGEFRVSDWQGSEVPLRGVPGRAVRILVASGCSLHIEQLADALWGEVLDPAQVRARIPNVVNRARLPAMPLLVRDGDIITIHPDVVIDADRFEAAAERAIAMTRHEHDSPDALDTAMTAVLLYAGDLLPTDPYADWAAPRREQLRHKYLVVSDLAARLAMQRGHADTAVDVLHAAIRHDPYDLERYDLAVTILESAGRMSAARSMRDRAQRVRAELSA